MLIGFSKTHATSLEEKFEFLRKSPFFRPRGTEISENCQIFCGKCRFLIRFLTLGKEILEV